jgi:hypothetical protein
MAGSGGYRVHEGSSLFQEIVELSIFVAGSTLLSSVPSGLSGDSQQDIGDLFEGKLLTRR